MWWRNSRGRYRTSPWHGEWTNSGPTSTEMQQPPYSTVMFSNSRCCCWKMKLMTTTTTCRRWTRGDPKLLWKWKTGWRRQEDKFPKCWISWSGILSRRWCNSGCGIVRVRCAFQWTIQHVWRCDWCGKCPMKFSVQEIHPTKHKPILTVNFDVPCAAMFHFNFGPSLVLHCSRTRMTTVVKALSPHKPNALIIVVITLLVFMTAACLTFCQFCVKTGTDMPSLAYSRTMLRWWHRKDLSPNLANASYRCRICV